MRALARVGLLALAACEIVACRPSLAAASSGMVGFAASEITITDDQSDWGTRTWVATCGSRSFRCSYVKTGGAVGATAGQVDCAPEQSDSPTATVVAAQPPPRPPPQKIPGAAGFVFGRAIDETRAACEEAGHEWSGETPAFSCSGTISDVGISARARLVFKEDALTTIVLVVKPSDDLATTFAKLSETLQKRYGAPDATERTGDDTCRGSMNAFAECLSEGTARLATRWRSDAGESVELSLGKTDDESAPTVKLRYARPNRPTGADSL